MSNVTARKRGSTWEFRFEIASVGGKRKWKTKGGFRTKAEALKAGTAACEQYNRTGSCFEPSTISVSDYLDYWLEKYVKQNCVHNTQSGYEGYVKNHLKPTFGMYKLSALSNNPIVIQEWIDGLKIKGYSKNMIKNLLSTLSGAMNYAVVPCKYIAQNPCSYVKIPKIKMDDDVKKKINYVLSQSDFNLIKERFIGTVFYLPLLIGYYLGLRIGETYGLMVEDVDFEKNTITIVRQMQKNSNGSFVYKSPKYDSCRTIKMPLELAKEMKSAIMFNKKELLRYGEHYTKTYVDNDNTIIQLPAFVQTALKEVHPICVRENGVILTTESFKYAARVIHNELGNHLFHYHSLRHTHGTLLAEAGINPRTVMERLGHKNIQTTLQTYTFNTDKMQDQAIDFLNTLSTS